MAIVTLEESNVVGAVDIPGLFVVAPVFLRFRIVAYQNAFDGSLVYFWVVFVLDEDEGLTANLAHV